MTNDIESIVSGMSDDEAEYIGRWWAMRQNALEIGILAEKQLMLADVLDGADRLFFNRKERRRLTKGA